MANKFFKKIPKTGEPFRDNTLRKVELLNRNMSYSASQRPRKQKKNVKKFIDFQAMSFARMMEGL